MPKLLLVEDDAVIQENLAAILEDEGYEVVCASQGEQALALLEKVPLPDILLLDLMMPVMNGWQMRKLMLERPAWAIIPCIIVSGAHDLGAQTDALSAQGFISKPIKLDKLLNAIEACLKA
jgi:CheY-like chemotaxis protein